MAAKLPLTDRPRHLESALGYICRLCELNGYPNFLWLNELYGGDRTSNQTRFDIHGKDLQPLASMAGQPLELIRQITIWPINNDFFHFYGLIIPRIWARSIDRDHSKMCRFCLHEFGYLFGYWDLRHVFECPIHLTPLDWYCRFCNAAIMRQRPSLLRCKRCGRRLDAKYRKAMSSTSVLADWLHPERDSPVRKEVQKALTI